MALSLALLVLPGKAATITVNSFAQSPGMAGDCTLGEAIQAANTDLPVDACTAGSGDDIIMTPAGTYVLTAVDNQVNQNNGLPVVSSTMTLQGGGASATIIERSTVMGTPAFRFLNVGAGTLTLNGLTFRNGRSPNADGGAINSASSVVNIVIQECIFENNSSSNLGGAILGFAASITTTDSVFMNNQAGGFGGAIDGGTVLTVSNSVFLDNSAPNLAGAVRCGQACTFTDTTFIGNSAASGGAIAVTIIMDVKRGVFIGNRATAGDGGAIWTSATDLPKDVTDSLFVDNTATGMGGAIQFRGLLSNVVGSTFSNNSAGSTGGALNYEGFGSVRNSTLFGNSANGQGGAIFITVLSSANELLNVTVNGNHSATGTGGGIAHQADAMGLFNVRDSIVAGNTNGGGTAPDCAGTINSQGRNLVGNGTGCMVVGGVGDQIGTAANPIDPLLGDLLDNGGITAGSNLAGQTPMVVPTLALRVGSPAIDAGSMPGTCLASDQRGAARPVGPVCDIGAFEGATDQIPVNDPPSFTAGPDQVVPAGSGTQTVMNWATNVSPGPPNESLQTVAFIVTNSNNALFATQPAIGPTGTLTYTPAGGGSGVATVTIRLMDNGGTANGGVDTSAPQLFTITVSDFMVVANPSSGTIVAGQSFTSTLTATALHANYNAGVTLTCGNLPLGVSCSFSPSTLGSVPLSGATIAFTFSTAPRNNARLDAPNGQGGSPLVGLWLALPGVMGLVLFAARRNRRTARFLCLLVVLSALASLYGCGSSEDVPTGTPAGVHTVTVTATGTGNLQRSVNLTITVQ